MRSGEKTYAFTANRFYMIDLPLAGASLRHFRRDVAPPSLDTVIRMPRSEPCSTLLLGHGGGGLDMPWFERDSMKVWVGTHRTMGVLVFDRAPRSACRPTVCASTSSRSGAWPSLRPKL